MLYLGHLKDQWRRELKERFEESFVVTDRALMEAHYAENVWERENQIITSLDFAKRDDILPSLASAKFDLVIADEAHKMSAYRYGDKAVKTGRYRLGEILSKSTDHLLFLTATPHKGDPENFRLFLDLLEPGFFATTDLLQESIRNKDNPLFIRRIKEDLKDFEGKPLFLPRHVVTVGFRLSDEEKILYNEVSRYVKEQYNKALRSEKKRSVAFALVILQRRLASSTYAIHKSLERRKKRLEDLVKGIEKTDSTEQVFDFDEVEDMSEDDRWKEEELWETLSVAENRQELEREIQTLNGLIEKARAIIQSEKEVKVLQLKTSMERLSKTYPNKRILIFTEAKDTLEYLEKKIKSWGYSVNTIHGGMKLEERVEAEKIFKNETQVLVATEAAGEGINLQFCHLMINYDIPWNPNRLEQRMGRIHRYGQTLEVYVFNMVAEDTREGKVLSILFEKLEEIKNALHSDKVFDVISEVLYGKNLSQLLLEAAASAKDINEILKEINVNVDEEYISKVRENLDESLATRYLDYTRLKDMKQKALENRLIPEYTASFFKRAITRAGGRMKERKDGFLSVDFIPYEVRTIASEDRFKKRFGILLRSYPKTTFDKEMGFRNPDTEFVSLGHPLFESILEWSDQILGPELQKGAVFVDPDGRMDGFIVFYEGEVRDGTGAIAGKSLFAYYYAVKSGNLEQVSPTIIWDIAEGNGTQSENIDLDSLKKKVLERIIHSLKSYVESIKQERNRQAALKEKYGINSLDKLIVDIDGEIIRFNTRKEGGENVDLAIRNKEEQRRKYEKSRDELISLIGKERSLTMNMPVFLGVIRIKPTEVVEAALQRDEEVERLAMETVLEYETRAGRKPEDVSKENIGFDIKSVDEGGNIRYIEVKGRAAIGSIALTQNEWFKAQRLGDSYYLYVIWDAKNELNNRLMTIKNPALNLSVQEKEVVRYIVTSEELMQKGNEVTKAR